MNPTTNENGLLFELSGTETPRIVIEHLNGDIAVEGWERSAVQVGALDNRDAEGLEELLDVEQHGNDLKIKLDLGGAARRRARRHREDFENFDDFAEGLAEMREMFRHLGKSFSADLVVQVPHTCDITVRTFNGDVSLHRVQGKLYVQNTSGDISLHEIRGNVLVKSASGDVEIKELRGRLGVRTASGDLSIQDSELAALSAGSASGDVQFLGALLPAEDYEIQTVSGDVEFVLPENRRASVELQTVSGDISCSRGLPHDIEKRNKRHRIVHVNGGGEVIVRVRTTSGDLTLTPGPEYHGSYSADMPTAEVSVAPEAAAGDETRPFTSDEADMARVALQGDGGAVEPGQTQRLDAHAEDRSGPRKSAEMTILDAIENGEMSVDEGLRRLNELAQ
jgi:DUF4097 and DUF4098 domain-containing protein YvlB